MKDHSWIPDESDSFIRDRFDHTATRSRMNRWREFEGWVSCKDCGSRLNLHQQDLSRPIPMFILRLESINPDCAQVIAISVMKL